MIRTVWRSRIVRIPFSRFVAVNMASSSGDSVDDSNPSVSPQAGGGKKAPQAGTGWISSLRRFFSHPSEGRNREYYENLPLDSKRALYTCGSKYLTLDKIQTWEEFQERKPCPRSKQPSPFSIDPTLNKKVSLWKGDITRLEIDAIVNAANSSLLGGGGVDGAIHSAAGYSLRDECAMLGGCSTGDAKITSGHRLPAKYILHTVGPVDGSEHKLRSCYTRCLQLTLENKIQSVAFCCIATGVYGYPNKKAAEVALETTRNWLELNADKVERVIFCVFLNIDYKIYQELLHYYFPLEAPTDSGDHDDGESHSSLEDTDGRSDSGGDGSVPRVPKLGRSVTEPAHLTSTSKSSQPEGQTQQPQVKEEQQITEQTSHIQEQEKAASDEVPPEQREEEQKRVVTEQMVDKQEQVQQVSQEQDEMVTDPPPVEKAMTPEHERCEEQVQQDTEQTEQQEESMEEEHTKKPRITTS